MLEGGVLVDGADPCVREERSTHWLTFPQMLVVSELISSAWAETLVSTRLLRRRDGSTDLLDKSASGGALPWSGTAAVGIAPQGV
jgi:hypothetical protein